MSTPSVQLPPKLPGAPPPSTTASPPDHQRDRLIHRAKLLSWLSLAYMTLEGAVAITGRDARGLRRAAGLRLGFRYRSPCIDHRDLALHGPPAPLRPSRATRAATRRNQLLPARPLHRPGRASHPDRRRSPHHQLARHRPLDRQHPHAPARPRQATHRPAARLRAATGGEGTQNMLCAYLAAGVLTSLVVNAAFGFWWADPAVSLAIAALAVHEGRQTWRGESCCAAPPIGADADLGCHEHCCASGPERSKATPSATGQTSAPNRPSHST